MKTYTVILLFLTIAMGCKTSQQQAVADSDEVLVRYSKSPCLGDRCRVYDFWVYQSGATLYKSTKGRREAKGKLSKSELAQLIALVEKNENTEAPPKKFRDIQVTNLRINGSRLSYHAPMAKGPLKELDSALKSIVEKLLEE